jgi:hypothetical protein
VQQFGPKHRVAQGRAHSPELPQRLPHGRRLEVQKPRAGPQSGNAVQLDGDHGRVDRKTTLSTQKTTTAKSTRLARRRVASTPTGTRTPVPWLRTKYPRPLDDGGMLTNGIISSWGSQSSLCQSSRLLCAQVSAMARLRCRPFWRFPQNCRGSRGFLKSASFFRRFFDRRATIAGIRCVAKGVGTLHSL